MPKSPGARFYKGIFLALCGISRQHGPNLMSVKVTISSIYGWNGNTELVDRQPAIAGTEVVEVLPTTVQRIQEMAFPPELDRHILFRYAPNTADNLLRTTICRIIPTGLTHWMLPETTTSRAKPAQ